MMFACSGKKLYEYVPLLVVDRTSTLQILNANIPLLKMLKEIVRDLDLTTRPICPIYAISLSRFEGKERVLE
jgi:hypothetical protein